ncbi:MAG: hypothetical protein ACI841_003233, partial [Planctomycetota bacterium]
ASDGGPEMIVEVISNERVQNGLAKGWNP